VEKDAAVEQLSITGIRKEARIQMPNGLPVQQRARIARACEIRRPKVMAMVMPRITAARLMAIVRALGVKAARIVIPTNAESRGSNTRATRYFSEENVNVGTIH
jgi:hypothetical protein